MKRWINKFESVFVSVTFAEMGEYDDARNMLGTMPVNPKKCLSINGHFVQYLIPGLTLTIIVKLSKRS
jgi:hypothetical protein